MASAGASDPGFVEDISLPAMSQQPKRLPPLDNGATSSGDGATRIALTPLPPIEKMTENKYAANDSEYPSPHQQQNLEPEMAYPKCLLFFLCLSTTAQGFLINGIVSVSITTLERRFHLSSTQTGVFSSMYDIAVCLVLIPVCHYGGKGHKGRWIGTGMLLLGLGSITCALPQFFSRAYASSGYSGNNTSILCLPVRSGFSSIDEDCNLQHDENVSPAYVVLLLGQLLHGFGASTIYTIGITYLDENVSQQSSPMYLAAFLGCSLLGSAMGYLVGGVFLKINGNLWKTDVENIAMTPEDSNWYGAWWLGYLMAAGMCWTAAVPLMCFPKTLAGTALIRQRDVNQAHASDSSAAVSAQIGFGENWAEFRRSLRTLLKNPTFLLLISVDCLEALADTGVVMYMPKIIQHFFAKSPSSSSVITGIVAVPAGVLGNILGGCISRRFQLKCAGMMILAALANCACFWLMLLFLTRCEQPLFAGVSVTYNRSIYFSNTDECSLDDPCNVGCSCNHYEYEPVCDQYSNTQFYSPCLAGCVNHQNKEEVIDGEYDGEI